MPEATVHNYAAWLELGLAVPTLLFLLFMSAPYGRHLRDGWGWTVPNRVGWIVMELPAVVVFGGIFFAGDHAFELLPLVFLGFWQLHYVHRTFVFPFRTRSGKKRMPILIPLAAVAFNSLNAYVNARWVSHFGAYSSAWLTDPRFVLGAAIFLSGMAINMHADTVLINLRKPGETGYKIPTGGLYRFITAPNYFGEILEWVGWAIMTWSLGGFAFAIYTAANLAPRALSNHEWYREKFPDYPASRKAILPFVL